MFTLCIGHPILAGDSESDIAEDSSSADTAEEDEESEEDGDDSEDEEKSDDGEDGDGENGDEGENEAEAGEEDGPEKDKLCHDFSHESWIEMRGICRVCHVKHNEADALSRFTSGIKWKRDISTVTYKLYNSIWGSARGTPRDSSWKSPTTGRSGNLPDSISKLCLSCHNGIIAPDVFTLHHFVSAVFDTERVTLRDPDTTIIGESGTIVEVLDKGKIECSSCHDVHGKESVEGTKLLRVKYPYLCTTCHNINSSEQFLRQY